MNCLDYRRLLASGERESAEMKAHRLECSGCADQFRDHTQFESALKRALEVQIPPALEERLTGALVLKRRRFLAAATVSVIAVGAGGYAWLRRDESVALACIEFVMMEEAKSLLKGSMPRAEAEQALAPILPLGRVERLGNVRHVLPCPFNGQNAYHVIVEVPQGKVTLLVMPEGSASGRANRDGLHSTVVSLRRGSVGVVGADRAVVESIASALRA